MPLTGKRRTRPVGDRRRHWQFSRAVGSLFSGSLNETRLATVHRSNALFSQWRKKSNLIARCNLILVRSDQMTVTLREVTQEDLPIFFEHQLDAEATRMAAFASRDRDAFMAHWAKIMSNETGILNTILADDTVAGNVVYWEAGGGAQHRLLARQDTLGEGDC
jgi:hypothetical protein